MKTRNTPTKKLPKETQNIIQAVARAANGKRIVLFDMDGTIYSPVSTNDKPGFENSRLASAVDSNALSFIRDTLNVADATAVLKKAKNDTVGISNYLEFNYTVPRDVYFDKVWELDPRPLTSVDWDLIAMIRNLEEVIPVLLTAAPRKWIENLLSYLGLEASFAATVSGEMYSEKTEVFEAFAKAYPPSLITSIGDQLETDIAPAIACGMRANLVEGPADTKQAIKNLNAPSIIIDTDPGVDDAVAIGVAFKGQLPIAGLTTVFGNSSVQDSSKNAATILNQIQPERVQIYEGAASPLVGKPTRATSHGKNGLSGFESDSAQPIAQRSALNYLSETLESTQEPVTIIALGPLTNVAALLQKRPDLVSSIRSIVIVGGAVGEPGNITEYAEFNTYNDPEALTVALNSDIQTILVPINICRRVVFDENMFKAIQGNEGAMLSAITKPYIHYYKNDARYGGFNGAVMYDLLAVLYVLDPSLFTVESASISVVTNGARRGETVVQSSKPANTQLVTEVNVEALKYTYRSLYRLDTA